MMMMMVMVLANQWLLCIFGAPSATPLMISNGLCNVCVCVCRESMEPVLTITNPFGGWWWWWWRVQPPITYNEYTTYHKSMIGFLHILSFSLWVCLFHLIWICIWARYFYIYIHNTFVMVMNYTIFKNSIIYLLFLNNIVKK